MPAITTIAELEAIYGAPQPRDNAKVAPRITPQYRALIEASPFAALSTAGPEGLDCSPRGDRPGFIRVVDDATLALPDRRGNNRVDSLRNIVRDPRAALLFLIPGLSMTLRVNGRARLDTGPDLLASFVVEDKAPRCVIVLAVDEVYFQCGRAVVRSGLWDPARHADPASLPTAGQILAAMTDGDMGGPEYDRAWPERARASLW